MKVSIATVALILAVGIVLGLALAEWFVGAAAAVGLTLIVVALALVLYLAIRRACVPRKSRAGSPQHE